MIEQAVEAEPTALMASFAEGKLKDGPAVASGTPCLAVRRTAVNGAHPPGRRVNTRVGDLDSPGIELGIEIIHVPERAGQEEVLPDIAEGPLDLAL